MGTLELTIGPKTATRTQDDAKMAAIAADIIAQFDLDPDETLSEQEKLEAVNNRLWAEAKAWSQQYRMPTAEQDARDDILNHSDYQD